MKIPKEVWIAYVLEDIDCGGFIIKKGRAFLVEDMKKKILKGLWHGSTDKIERLDAFDSWTFGDKLNYYKICENCLYCKYVQIESVGYGCNREMCYLEED